MKEKSRRLKEIATWINDNMSSTGYEAKIEKGFCDTDRKVGRLRIPGKGRTGNKIIISKDGKVIKEHNAAETYRSNDEVESWLERELKGLNKNPWS